MNKITCDPDTIYRQCPHCRCFIFANIHENGNCPKCGKPYEVEIHLSEIKIVAPFSRRNVEKEIIDYIGKVGKTYTAEIVKALHIAEGTVYYNIYLLKDRNVIKVTPYGNKRMIELVA